MKWFIDEQILKHMVYVFEYDIPKLLNVSRLHEHAPTKWFDQMLLPS